MDIEQIFSNFANLFQNQNQQTITYHSDENTEELQYSKLVEQKIHAFDTQIYRMNILAVSIQYKYLFIGASSKILYYDLQDDGQINSNVNHPPIFISNDEQENSINQIKIKQFGKDEYLICVTENSEMIVYDIKNLSAPLYNFDNTYEDEEDNTT